MKVPVDIDELMWQIAESGDSEAVSEFHSKFPDFSPEMTKRIAMVSSLKGSRPKAVTRKRERFMPSRQVSNPAPTFPAWSFVLMALLLAFSVSFATYGITKYLDQKNRPIATITPQNPTPQTTTSGSVSGTNTAPLNPTNNQPLPDNPATTTPPQTIQPFDRPITIVSGRMNLVTAINDIAAQAGIRIDLAPGFEDMEIMIDYRAVPAMEAIQDMGKNFGFTAFQQTNNSALLVPAEDPNRTDSGRPTSGSSQLPPATTDSGSTNELRGR